MKAIRRFLVLSSFCILSGSLLAQETVRQSFITVSGEVTKPLKLTGAELMGMKATAAKLIDRDEKEHNYKGVSIQEILNKAGVTTGKDLRGENLSKYLLVKCADGYEVVFSLAELDSSFTERVVILAYEMDGGAIPTGKGPFRLVVPNERKPARSCQQVVGLSVRFSKE